MRCQGTSFLVDYTRGEDRAVAKMPEWDRPGEFLRVPAIAAAELLVGAHYLGGKFLTQTLEFLDQLQVIPFEEATALEAAAQVQGPFGEVTPSPGMIF